MEKAKKIKYHRAPFIAEFFLKLVIDESEKEALLGDLEEMYNIYMNNGNGLKARLWYYQHVLKLTIRYIIFSLFWGGTMFGNNIKLTLRNLKKHRGYAAINIFGLAVGICCFVLISRYAQYEFNWDTFNENYNRIYRIHSNVSIDNGLQVYTSTPYPLAEHLRNNYPEFEKTVALRRSWGLFLSREEGDTFAETNGFYSDPQVFDIFTIKFLEGNAEKSLADPYSIVLTKRYVDKYFPDENPMGKIMKMSKRNSLRVTGVIENFPEDSHIQPNFFISFSTLKQIDGKEYYENWDNNSYLNYVLLSENQTPEIAEQKISGVIDEFIENSNKELFLKPLSELHLNPHPYEDSGVVVYYYATIAFFILLLACVNFINLTTAYSSTREKEIGVRKVVGSSRANLIKQFLSETFIICLIAMVFAFLLAEMFMSPFNDVVFRNLSIEYFSNWSFMLFMFGVLVFVSVLSGAYPAFFLSGAKPVTVLKGGAFQSSNIKGKGKLRKMLVIFQFVISLTLIMSTIYCMKHVNYLKTMDLGFNNDNLIYSYLDHEKEIDYEAIRSRVLRIPGVENMANGYHAPFFGSSGREMNWEGGLENEKININYNRISYDFIDIFEMEMVKGRSFSRNHSTDLNGCILNETAVKMIGWDDPIGKRVFDNKYSVIGVIKDFNFQGVHNPIRPLVMLLNDSTQQYSSDFVFKVTPGDLDNKLKLIKNELKILFPDAPFEVQAYDLELGDQSFMIWGSVAKTFSFFSVISILIAIVGLFALVSFAVKRKTKEIGIRKVLGASLESIYYLVTKEFLVTLLIAIVIAVPLGYLTSVTTPGAYKYQMTIWDVILPSLGILLLAALVTAYKTITAANANPSSSLRDE